METNSPYCRIRHDCPRQWEKIRQGITEDDLRYRLCPNKIHTTCDSLHCTRNHGIQHRSLSMGNEVSRPLAADRTSMARGAINPPSSKRRRSTSGDPPVPSTRKRRATPSRSGIISASSGSLVNPDRVSPRRRAQPTRQTRRSTSFDPDQDLADYGLTPRRPSATRPRNATPVRHVSFVVVSSDDEDPVERPTQGVAVMPLEGAPRTPTPTRARSVASQSPNAARTPPAYSPTSPPYHGARSPAYSQSTPPRYPETSASSPSYAPTSPVGPGNFNTRTSPAHSPTSPPAWSATSPRYAPNSPNYVPNSPVIGPDSPGHSPTSPVADGYTPHSPTYAPNSPYVAQTSSGQGRAPSRHPSAPNVQPARARRELVPSWSRRRRLFWDEDNNPLEGNSEILIELDDEDDDEEEEVWDGDGNLIVDDSELDDELQDLAYSENSDEESDDQDSESVADYESTPGRTPSDGVLPRPLPLDEADDAPTTPTRGVRRPRLIDSEGRSYSPTSSSYPSPLYDEDGNLIDWDREVETEDDPCREIIDQRNALLAERFQWLAERDDLVSEIALLNADRDDLHRSVALLIVDRDALHGRLAQEQDAVRDLRADAEIMVADVQHFLQEQTELQEHNADRRERLEIANRNLRAERDQLHRQAEQTEARRDAEYNAVRTQRDDARTRLVATHARWNDVRSARDDARTERDDARTERDTALAERDAARREVARLQAGTRENNDDSSESSESSSDDDDEPPDTPTPMPTGAGTRENNDDSSESSEHSHDSPSEDDNDGADPGQPTNSTSTRGRGAGRGASRGAGRGRGRGRVRGRGRGAGRGGSCGGRGGTAPSNTQAEPTTRRPRVPMVVAPSTRVTRTQVANDPATAPGPLVSPKTQKNLLIKKRLDEKDAAAAKAAAAATAKPSGVSKKKPPTKKGEGGKK
jgi:hypothetical protein